MKFDMQRTDLEEKLKALPSLDSLLKKLEADDENVADDPAKRIVLPYSGIQPIRGEKWKKS